MDRIARALKAVSETVLCPCAYVKCVDRWQYKCIRGVNTVNENISIQTSDITAGLHATQSCSSSRGTCYSDLFSLHNSDSHK